MADINIQRKKARPSPWILVVLAVLALAAGAYFFLRPDPADDPVPVVSASPVSADTATVAAAENASATSPTNADTTSLPDQTTESADPVAALALHAGVAPATPGYALTGLQKLTAALVMLTDRNDLRDASTAEQRDNLTSATSRLSEANASLRPGFVAAAGLIRALQQKAYPDLESQANELVNLAGQLSGRNNTLAEQEQNQRFLTLAAATLRTLSVPAS